MATMQTDYRIKYGDIVKLKFTNKAECIGAIVNMPSATGELIHITDDEGKIYYINPMALTFEGMELVHRL